MDRYDLVAMSGGYSPTVQLFTQSGGKLRFDEENACFVPDRSVQAEQSAGAAAGRFTLAEALEGGHSAGRSAAEAAGFPEDCPPPRAARERPERPLRPVWQVAGGRAKAFVDFQNDVAVDDIALSHRENFVSVEHLKRYTTLGMAADQGKTSNVNALAIMAALTGRGVGETGTTRHRFPFTPMPLGSLAGLDGGDLFRPIRLMPAHERHAALGALFEDYGGWQRPSCYPLAGETPFEAEQREALAVRTRAGLFEGSPLGKIEIVGPDAARFLDLVYANTMSTLKPGSLRYGLMLNEQGVIIDDGVTARLGEDRFLVGTTSGGADRIAAWLEEWLQCEWRDLDVLVAPVTTAWGVATLTGPAARTVLGELGTDIDFSPAAFPHMTFRDGTLGGLPVRIMRVSYTGEASYEINVRAGRMAELWTRLMAAGERHGLAPVGIDAWMLLRTEKGYLHVGADTDGATTPLDVGWRHVLRRQSDFIGRRSLLTPENQRPGRLGFVGFAALDAAAPPLIGAHVVVREGRATRSAGYVTSAGFSPVLGRTVALGMIEGGAARQGDTVELATASELVRARVSAPAAYDPQGARLDG